MGRGGADESEQSFTYRITAIPTFITVWNGGTQVYVNATPSLSELNGLAYKPLPTKPATTTWFGAFKTTAAPPMATTPWRKNSKSSSTPNRPGYESAISRRR